MFLYKDLISNQAMILFFIFMFYAVVFFFFIYGNHQHFLRMKGKERFGSIKRHKNKDLQSQHAADSPQRYQIFGHLSVPCSPFFECFHECCLCTIFKVCWSDFITNSEVLSTFSKILMEDHQLFKDSTLWRANIWSVKQRGVPLKKCKNSLRSTCHLWNWPLQKGNDRLDATSVSRWLLYQIQLQTECKNNGSAINLLFLLVNQFCSCTYFG